MNWIIKFNQLEKENTDKVLDIVTRIDKYKNDKLDEVYTKAYTLKHSIDNLIDKLNAHAIVGEELRQEVERLIRTHIQIQDEYESAMSEIRNYVYICGSEVIELNQGMIKTIKRYLRSNKDFFMMQTRMDVFTKKLIDMSYSLDMLSIDEEGIFPEVYHNIMLIKNIIETRNKEYDDKQYEMMEKLKESQKKDYFKIFDYKEMIDLAEKHGYKQVRQRGDHIIMQHNKTNKILPIPAHELKYGLMLQIQKQIQANKVS